MHCSCLLPRSCMSSLVTLKHLPNVAACFYCPQTFLTVNRRFRIEKSSCDSSTPSHGQPRAYILTTHAMSFCKLAVQAIQGNEAMTRQAVIWQMLRGPKHRLRTKGTDSHMAAWLLESTQNLAEAAVSHWHISVQFPGSLVH